MEPTDPKQQRVLLLAMYVRDRLEDFHVKHLSDGQMKELNQLIRQGLWDILTMLELFAEDEPGAIVGWHQLVAEIPACWEIPSDTERVDGTEDPEFDGITEEQAVRVLRFLNLPH